MQRSLASLAVLASAATAAAVVASCSGGDFESSNLPGDDTALDSASESASDAVDSGVDTSLVDVADTTVGDTGPDSVDTSPGDVADGGDAGDTPDTILTVDVVPIDGIVLDSGCPLLGTDATDVYVDSKAKPGTGTGTIGCPFNTILQASALTYTGSGVRTIHVAGTIPDAGTTATTYAETAPIVVGNKIRLLAEPTNSVLVKCNTLACSSGPATRASIEVGYGGKVDGFIVEAGMATYPISTAASGTSTTVPVLSNLLAQSGTSHGIAVNGGADLGPNVRSQINGGAGLALLGSGTTRVMGSGDTFDFNTGAGVLVSGSSVLDFQGGEASNNTGNGITIGTTSTATQSIANLKAKSNANGVSTGDTFKGTLKIRGSTLVSNSGFGLRFIFQYDPTTSGALNFLDIGTGSDPGNVVFNGVTARNSKGGICLGQTSGPDSQVAHTDQFSVCDPAQQNRDCSLSATTTYTDVWFVPKSGSPTGNPLKVSACTAGP